MNECVHKIKLCESWVLHTQKCSSTFPGSDDSDAMVLKCDVQRLGDVELGKHRFEGQNAGDVSGVSSFAPSWLVGEAV